MTFLYLAVGALLLFLLAAWVCYMIAFGQPELMKRTRDPMKLPAISQIRPIAGRVREMIGALEAKPCERVEIRSRDGLRLSAKYYEFIPGAPLGICVHGYRGTTSQDFCGGAALLEKMGWNLLMIEQRAHGRSGGHTITFGVKERFDLLDWTDWALQRFGRETEIGWYGVSMGASTVLLAAGLLKEGKVLFGVADAPYDEPEEIIRNSVRGMGLPVWPTMPLLKAGARLFGGFSFDGIRCSDAVSRSPVPLLVIHGVKDLFVPSWMSVPIRDAAPDIVRREVFPDAGHAHSYMTDPARYEAVVREFIASAVPAEKTEGKEQDERNA